MSGCLGSRTPGRVRQLVWILQGKDPSRKECRVGAARSLSDDSRTFLASKLGLGGVPELEPDPAVERIGVDLIRGLALFGFSSRAQAERLGQRVLDRRKREEADLSDDGF